MFINIITYHHYLHHYSHHLLHLPFCFIGGFVFVTSGLVFIGGFVVLIRFVLTRFVIIVGFVAAFRFGGKPALVLGLVLG